MNDFTLMILGGLLAICLAYAMTRAASVAHFRTKLEYWRSITREGKQRNGEE